MKKLCMFLMLFVLAGCFGTTPQSSFYMLTSQTEQVVSNKKLQIAVEPVKIPQFLDRPQIVTLTNNGMQLNVAETKRWAEPLSSMIQRVIINNLASCLPDAQIRPKTFTRDKYDYIVYVDINKMDATFDKELVLSAWWSLIDMDGKTVYRTQTNLNEPLDDGYDALVLGQSRLLAKLSRQIAQKVSTMRLVDTF